MIETLLDKDSVEMKETLVGIANTKFSEKKALVVVCEYKENVSFTFYLI